MECPRCALRADDGANYCSRCGFALEVVRYDSGLETDLAPQCPRCGQPVRNGRYPQRLPGLISPRPWNGEWNGTCEQCEFDFAVTRGWQWQRGPGQPARGVRRRVAVRPATQGRFQDLDVQFCMVGLEIDVETDQYGGPPEQEHYFLTKDEIVWLTRLLQGPLSICFQQNHWDVDVT